MSNKNGPIIEQGDKAYKYSFKLQFIKLVTSIPFPCEAKFVWKRASGDSIQSQKLVSLMPEKQSKQSVIQLNEQFASKSTIIYNYYKKEFRPKLSKLGLQLIMKGSPKNAGQHQLDLATLLNPFNPQQKRTQIYTVSFGKGKPPIQLTFRLSSQFIQQMTMDNGHKSIGSGVGSISSVPIGMKSVQLQSHQSGQVGMDRGYVDKKTIFLSNQGQVPSKDNHSVISYTSYGNGARFSSNSNRKERDDSNSVKRQQFGTMKRQRQYFNSTTGALRSNISQEYDLQSRGGGKYERFQNKTQNFDQTNKLLQDQQTKRSKLQAQLNRSTIYTNQLNKKLTQYVTQNTHLKEQLHKISSNNNNDRHYEQLANKIKSQNNQMHTRVYQLNSENRQLHAKYEGIKISYDSNQQNFRNLSHQKERLQNKCETLLKQIENIQSSRESSTRIIDDLKSQLQHIRTVNSNLRQNIQTLKRKTQEQQYSGSSQIKKIQQQYLQRLQSQNAQLSYLKKRQEKLIQAQKNLASTILQLKSRQNQLMSKSDIVYRLQRTNDQYKHKIMNTQQQKNSLVLQKNNLLQQSKFFKEKYDALNRELMSNKQELSKLRSQFNQQLQSKQHHLNVSNSQNLNKIILLQEENKSKMHQLNQLKYNYQSLKKEYQAKNNQNYRLDNNLKSLREIQNKFHLSERNLIQKQKETTTLRDQIYTLQMSSRYLHQKNRQLQTRAKQMQTKINQKPSKNTIPDVDVSDLLRESVQMQVELKFKTDELARLKSIEEQYDQLNYTVEVQKKNRAQAQEQLEQMEKQLKQKNKLYLIQIQKGKIKVDELNQRIKENNQIKEQIVECQTIIFNGDKQVKQMQSHIIFQEKEIKSLSSQIQQLQSLIQHEKNKQRSAITNLQQTVRHLQKEVQDKTHIINQTSSNIANFQKRIQNLSTQNHQLKTNIVHLQQTYNNFKISVNSVQNIKQNLQNQLQKATLEKKSAQKKAQLVMEELHAIKKKFQEEKGRSTSIVSIRNTQEQAKIRLLQNQVQKKDKIISKLTKQKLQIQEQNINLHVQVMKKLSQMQKGKDNEQTLSSGTKILLTPESKCQ